MIKPAFILLLLFFLSLSAKSQEITAFIKDTFQNSFSVKEFKKYTTLKLSDSSLKVKSFVVFIACHLDYQMKKGRNKDIGVLTVNGNSLKGDEFLSLVKKFKNHFYLVFDNVLFTDKTGKTRGALPSPARIDIIN